MDIVGAGMQQTELHADMRRHDMPTADVLSAAADDAMNSPLAAATLLAVGAACRTHDGLGSSKLLGERHLPNAAAQAEAGGSMPGPGPACMQPAQQEVVAGSKTAALSQKPRAQSLPPQQKLLRKSSRVRPASSAPLAPSMQQQQRRAGSRSEAQAAGEGATQGFVLVAKALTKSDTHGRVILPRVMVETNLPFLMGYRC